jgi:tRNA A-37 threonylcarbamoyl transferase component Bud32
MTARQPDNISRLHWKPGATTAPVAGRRKLLWRVLLLLAIAAFILAGYWIHNRVEEALQQIVSEDLQTILEIDIAALEFWMEQERSNVISWAGEEHLRNMTQSLQELASGTSDLPEKLQAAPEQARLRELLEPLLDTDNYLGFAIINSAGLILAAGADDERIIGQRLTPQGHAGLARVFTQEGSWIAPFWRGQYIESASLQEDVTLMGVSATVVDSAGRPLAALLLFVPPEKDFTRILSIARMGESGDTYAFDAGGVMLSDTRHLESLKATGILPDAPTVRAMLRVELRDPGGNLLKGYRTDTPMAGRPLTRLVAAALSDDSRLHVTLDRYRDYRGVPVVGAARWLPRLGFGVATEVNAAEAFSALRPIEITFWVVSALLFLALAGLIVFGVIVRRLGRRIEAIKQLGQYTLEKKIGEGGMGEVYIARHALLRRPTAVKLLSATNMDQENLERFEHEVQLTSQLTHPNTIEIYDYGHTREGVFYYVMEYLPGIDLSRLIEEEGAIPANRAAHILCQVCGSLSEAHARGLIHRDVKPMNIILTDRGGQLDFVKVLDFGLVKDLNTNIERTVADAIPGTPPYIAPERLSDPRNIDCRSDLYSVGAVAFNLLTGKPLFEGNSSMDIAYKVVAETAPRVSEFVDVDAELDQLISDCLERKPDARPQSAQAVIDRLRAIIGQDTWSQADARKWWDRHPEWLGKDAGEN